MVVQVPIINTIITLCYFKIISKIIFHEKKLRFDLRYLLIILCYKYVDKYEEKKNWIIQNTLKSE